MFGPSRFLLASVVSASLILLGAGQCPLASAQDAANDGVDQHRFTNSQPKVTFIRSNQTDTSSSSQQNWPWEFVFEKPAHFA